MSAAASYGGGATAASVPAAAATPNMLTNGQAIILKQQGRSSKAKEDQMTDFSLAMSKVVPGYTKIGNHEWDQVRSLSHVPYTPVRSRCGS